MNASPVNTEVATFRTEVYIEPTVPKKKALMWIWETFAADRAIRFNYSSVPTATVTIGTAPSSSIRYNAGFWNRLDAGVYAPDEVLHEDGCVYFEDGTPDYFSTAFYLINCIQEYSETQRDELGRFLFSASVQKKLNKVRENTVARYFELLAQQLFPGLVTKKRSIFFFSHDIDAVFGAPLQDGKKAIEQKRWLSILPVLLNKKAWQNIPAIAKLEASYGIRSTFFWLVNKGKVTERIWNSDYSINDPRIRRMMQEASVYGADHGLHKSYSNDSFAEELLKLDLPVIANRNHFLLMQLPAFWQQIEEANLQVDCTLGFAEEFGFRNSYGLPFYPFDLKVNRARRFLEVPLNVMDGTFSTYKKVNTTTAWEEIKSFFNANTEQAVISVLWHNTNFTDYKYRGFPQLYQNILEYVQQNNFESLTATDLAKHYSPERHSPFIFNTENE